MKKSQQGSLFNYFKPAASSSKASGAGESPLSRRKDVKIENEKKVGICINLWEGYSTRCVYRVLQ